MDTIDFDKWEPNPEKPGTVRRVGQRTAQEVFTELQNRLKSVGYLPDEYFLMGDEWRNGKEIPEDAAFSVPLIMAAVRASIWMFT